MFWIIWPLKLYWFSNPRAQNFSLFFFVLFVFLFVKNKDFFVFNLSVFFIFICLEYYIFTVYTFPFVHWLSSPLLSVCMRYVHMFVGQSSHLLSSNHPLQYLLIMLCSFHCVGPLHLLSSLFLFYSFGCNCKKKLFYFHFFFWNFIVGI